MSVQSIFLEEDRKNFKKNSSTAQTIMTETYFCACLIYFIWRRAIGKGNGEKHGRQ